MLSPETVKVKSLGECLIPSPVGLSTVFGDGVVNYVPDDAQMPVTVENTSEIADQGGAYFEKAGPREKIYFDPANTSAAIVTCGGLCPGLNNVIRSLVLELHHHYKVKNILGVRYGYRGLDPNMGFEPIDLTPEFVEDIHKDGGTVLGSSRGPVDLDNAVGFLRDKGVNVLFCIGGDGTQRGAQALSEKARSLGYPISVIGIPKTIDNDIKYVNQTFGYYTAIDQARDVIDCAHNEARSAIGGIAVVKLMGRDAGFIAAGATVASQDVNMTLVPEQGFKLDGPGGLFELLEKRIIERDHAVVVVAEGAGRNLLPKGEETLDASGNVLFDDIGVFLAGKIKSHFKDRDVSVTVKYIDPSYTIRSVAANCEDALLCDQMARNAAHAGMAGRTEMLIGFRYDVFIHVPIPLVTSRKKCMSPESDLWRSVLSTTGQPIRIGAATQ
ncbi:MAG: ATP-dependent 6-phosphofructokinase [Phycisphaerales bacterium]|jgi:6-phosphofructokinase 1|nr:ATP-dependent 6-phosphofructokinase [Phycisphaerales bacterium]